MRVSKDVYTYTYIKKHASCSLNCLYMHMYIYTYIYIYILQIICRQRDVPRAEFLKFPFIWRFPEMGVAANHPCYFGFCIRNHPAVGEPPFMDIPPSVFPCFPPLDWHQPPPQPQGLPQPRLPHWPRSERHGSAHREVRDGWVWLAPHPGRIAKWLRTGFRVLG